MKVIENIITGRRFEILDGALYPDKIYKDVTAQALEEKKKMDLDYIETPVGPIAKEPEEEPKPKKKAKKSRKKSSKKNDEKKS